MLNSTFALIQNYPVFVDLWKVCRTYFASQKFRKCRKSGSNFQNKIYENFDENANDVLKLFRPTSADVLGLNIYTY